MIPVIICIVGPSGSGKTTASLILQKNFGWKAIVSYTTRPMRKNETNGIDHWFVGKGKVPSKDKMCAYTQFGGYEYWTEWTQFMELFPCVYVIDEKGLVNLRSKEQSPFPFSLITIKIKRDDTDNIDQSRKDRDLERIHIPDELYDYIVLNNGSIQDLEATLESVATSIIQNF